MINVDKIGHSDNAKIEITFDTETERDQIMVMLEALHIFSQKNERYNDAWRKYGSYGGAFFVKDRAERIWETMKRGDFHIEDALDMINLAAFTIRSEREDNRGGQYWKPDELGQAEPGDPLVCAICGNLADPCPISSHAGRLPLSIYDGSNVK